MKPEVIAVCAFLVLYGFVVIWKSPGRSDEGARQFSAGMGCATVTATWILLCVAAIGWIFERA